MEGKGRREKGGVHGRVGGELKGVDSHVCEQHTNGPPRRCGGRKAKGEGGGWGLPDHSKASQRIPTSCLTIVPFTSHLGGGE